MISQVQAPMKAWKCEGACADISAYISPSALRASTTFGRASTRAANAVTFGQQAVALHRARFAQGDVR